jgi:hypothetical protein
MHKLNLTKILTAASMFLAFFFLPFFSAQAIEYGGFGGRPAYPIANNSRTQSIFVHALDPGATQDEGVLVVNNTTVSKTLLVYAADSTPSSGGAFACKQFAEEKTDVGAWITLAKSEVTLDPGKNEIVPFTIIVPQNASVGEHNGCILIQEKKDPVVGQTGAVLSVRTGIRVAITVPGEITRKLEIVGFTVTPAKDSFLLQPLVKNTGNVSIDADVQVATRYFFGSILAIDGGQYPILRDETSDWNFELKKPFWGGWYYSNFTVGYDANPGASVGVTSGKLLTTLTGVPVWFFSFPTPTALIIEIAVLLLIIFIIWFLFWLLRKRKKDGSGKARSHTKRTRRG